MKKQLLGGLMGLINLLTYATSPVGKYHCIDFDLKTGKKNQCEMVIQKTKATYQIITTCEDKSRYEGTALFDIKRQLLSIAFYNPTNMKEQGIAVGDYNDYPIQSTYTYLGENRVGKTTCERG